METTRLLAQITDADEDVRNEAIHELTLRMDDEVARAFLDVASSDAAEEARADVIVGLGPIIEEAGMDYYDEESIFGDDPDLGPPVTQETFDSIVREVRGLYDDPSQPMLVRRRAFEVLIRDPQPWQAAEVRRNFASEDPEWRRTAVFAMGYVNGFDEKIAELVERGEGELLVEAVRAAGRRQVTAAAPCIRELANAGGTDKLLRLFAIEALPHVDRDSFDVLDRLTRSKDEEIVEAAEAALEELALEESLDDAGFDDDDSGDEEDGFDDEDEDDEESE